MVGDMSEAEKIAVAVVEALESKRQINQDTHHQHHDYIETLIIKENRLAEAWDQVKMHVAKFGSLGVVTFVAWACWHYFNEILKNGGIPPQ